VAMEQPKSLEAEDIRNAKVAVLKFVRTPTENDEVVVGQYTKSDTLPGYLDDDTVPIDSNTETFAQMVLWVNNDRWRGVPFICTAGKGLDERRCEVILQLRQQTDSLYPNTLNNELVIRIQPDEGIGMRVNVKTPGLFSVNHVVGTDLMLSYKQKFQLQKPLPGAYTRLILDAVRGEHGLFVRTDELMEAWRVVDKVIKAVGKRTLKVQPYVRGSRGPEAAQMIASKYWLQQTRRN